jgi:prevent-host-death family protein
MTKHVTLRDANQNFARYVREAEQGEEIVITRRGQPVARLSAARAHGKLTPKQRAALERILASASKGWHSTGEPFDRDALYER